MPRRVFAKSRPRRYSDPVSFADPDDVQSWAAGMPEAFLACRDLGHTWRPQSARYDTELNSYARTLRCNRCRTTRSQTLSLSGLIMGNHYEYPDGYQVPAGSGRIDQQGRGVIRLQATIASLDAATRKRA